MASFEKYGSITPKKNGKFQANFWNPIEKKNYYVGYGDSYEEAEEKLGKMQFDFFKNNKYLIPKGICLDGVYKKFQFQITIVRELAENKTYTLSSHITMEKAVKAKKEFISNLI